MSTRDCRTALWPMFGMANQLLATAALSVATTIILREGAKKMYVLCTLLPLAFVGTTTFCAGFESIRTLYWPMTHDAAARSTGLIDTIVSAGLLSCLVAIVFASAARWVALVGLRASPARPAPSA